MCDKKTTINVMALTEQHSGMRLCKACNKLLPLSEFHPTKRKFTCLTHLRAAKRKEILGTHEKRAFNSLRCRARQDMLMFGRKRMSVSRKQVEALLTDEQLSHFDQYSLIPRDPEDILSVDNIVVVSKFQRHYVIGRWRATRDPAQYKRDLDFILDAPNHVASHM